MMTEVQRKIMSVNLEIKGMLARLLATEDLIVEHKKVDTACFNVQTRCLTLPLWEKASNKVYDLLVAHEVGHALETPQDEWEKEYDIPPQFVNVTEDARIEKLMKRRYPGLPRTFYMGYKELHDDDFFCLEGEDINKMNLADRANIHFKIGNFININFTEKEQSIIDMIGSAETFVDALKAAQALYDYCKEEDRYQCELPGQSNEIVYGTSDDVQSSGMSTQITVSSIEPNSDSQENADQPQETSQSIPSSGDQENKSKPKNNTQENTSGSEKGDEKQDKEPEVKTVEALKKSIENLVDMNSSESMYFELPEVDLNTVVVSNKEIYQHIEEDFVVQQNEYDYTDIFSTYDSKYLNFKASAQKEVNYLVKEFEARKAAKSYSRAATSTTGVLDCARLHTYKFNDDLFKRVTTLADGKNHGLVFILDWSGSMSEVMIDTIKQLYNLIWFCRKVSIPFEVYAFTIHWGNRVTYDQNNNPIYPKKHYVEKDGFACLDESFSLLNIFTSKVNNLTLEKQMKNLWRVCSTFSYHGFSAALRCPPRMGLSGTPLNESLVCLHQILPAFEKNNKLEKVHCVILTDGEANPLSVHKKYKNWGGEIVLQRTYINLCTSYLRDRKTGNTYKFMNDPFNFSATLLRNLKDNFPNVSFIGMRILNSRDVNVFVKRYINNSEYFNKLMESWKKDKSFSIKTTGYDTYFGLSSAALSVDAEFQVNEDASKGQIKNAFMKSLKSKKMNKKILKEFVELIS